jgi:ATP-dependent Clp protease ATP-binding subunit ClpA
VLKEGVEMISNGQQRKMVTLNPEVKSPLAEEFESSLSSRVVGQDRAVRSIASLYQVFQAGMTNPTRPLGTMLFLGPTGAG